MKLKRRFYDSSINLSNISTERLVLGVVIGLAYAFAIYSFAYLTRESIRLMSGGFGYLPNILSEDERSVYNWFFAALSLIFGNSIAISIIFGGTNHYFGKKQIKNRRIINDQIFLNSSFAFWFLKVCYIIGIFSMSFSDFNFLPEYIYFIITLIIVLYFDTWKTISLVFRHRRFKWMLIHFLFFLISSYSLSKLDLVDYRKIDNNQLSFKPTIELPKSNYRNVSFLDHYLDVFLKENDDEKLSFGYYKNDLRNSHLDFREFKSKLYGRYQENAAIRISANKDEKMPLIKSIEYQIRKADIPYLIYATFEDDLFAKRFSNSGIKIKLTASGYQENNVPNNFYFHKIGFYKFINNLKPKDTLKVKIGNTLMINNSEISEDSLVIEFQRKINKNIIFQYELDSNTEYQNYITVLSSHLKATEIIREKHNKVQLIWNNEKFKYENKEQFIREQQRLRFDFPFLVIEKFN